LISCANHDYVEIACLYRFEILLVLKDGQVLRGKALQTAYNANREECLVMETGAGNEEIVLDQVASMKAITNNPHFEKLDFIS
jgi:Rho-binding antiterminator